MSEGCFSFDKARADDEASGIVNSQSEDLKFLTRPPLVRRTVVLKKIIIALALPSATEFGSAFKRLTKQLSHVFTEILADI
jgi:hypothetical protein